MVNRFKLAYTVTPNRQCIEEKKHTLETTNQLVSISEKCLKPWNTKNVETPSIRLGKKKKIASSGGPSGASSISFPAEVPAEKRET